MPASTKKIFWTMKPPSMPANVADTITVVNITNITIVPRFAGRMLFIADAGGVRGVDLHPAHLVRIRVAEDREPGECRRRRLHRHGDDRRDDVLGGDARQRVPEIAEPAADVPTDERRKRAGGDDQPEDDQDPADGMAGRGLDAPVTARDRGVAHRGSLLVGDSGCR